MSPTEPGWYQSPDDPSDIERWYTGADWSEYTRPLAEESPEVDLEVTAEVAPETITAGGTDEPGEPAETVETVETVESGDNVEEAATVEVVATVDGAAATLGESADTAPTTPFPTAPDSDQAASSAATVPNQAVSGPPPMQPPTAPPPAPASLAAPLASPPPPPTESRAPANQAMAFARSWMDRLVAMGNDSESGVDRNLAVMTWLPIFGPAVWIAYLFTGRSWSAVARGHVVGSINLALTVTFVQATVVGSVYLGQSSVGLGVLLLLIGGSLLGLAIWFMSERYGQSVGHWVWLGIIMLLAFLSLVGDESLFNVYVALMGAFMVALIISNVVRARLGMARGFLAFPVVPVLSER